MEEEEGEYLMLMNKCLAVGLILFYFLSCNNMPSRNKANEIVKQNNQTILPDSTINGKLYLEDYTTLANFYFKNNLDLIEGVRSSPVILFANINDSEYLLAYQYEGDTKNSFGCFEIGYIKDFPKFIPYKVKTLHFQTESGVHLGMFLNELIQLKGHNYEKKEVDDKTVVITYRIDSLELSSFLKRYNMPSYFMKCTFANDKIKKIEFGFDYP